MGELESLVKQKKNKYAKKSNATNTLVRNHLPGDLIHLSSLRICICSRLARTGCLINKS